MTEEPTGLRAASLAELAALDLWLALAEPGLTRLNMMGLGDEARASLAQQRIASLMPLGGLARVGGQGGFGVAQRSPPEAGELHHLRRPGRSPPESRGTASGV